MLIKVNNTHQLRSLLSELNNNNDLVFRGQTKNYSSSDSEFSFTTSFNRTPCIPTELFKWSYHCSSLLRYLYKYEWEDNHTEKSYVQGLLQHYGWRSFFIDITKSIDVAVWFACNKYNQKNIISTHPDCFDDLLLMEGSVKATYKPSKVDYGYIFVFNKKSLESCEHYDFIDLETDGVLGPNTRPIRQSGCLFGLGSNRSKDFNIAVNDCLVKVIQVKTSILLDYIHTTNLNQYFLFPDRTEDDIYCHLVNLPRIELTDPSDRLGIINSFLPSIKIPEYDTQQVPPPSNIAYYSSFWLSDSWDQLGIQKNHGNPNKDHLPSATQIRTCEDLVYLRPVHDPDSKYLLDFLNQYPNFILEFDYLYRVFEEQNTFYLKAIHCFQDNGLICVREIIAEHPGTYFIGMAVNHGTFYKISNGHLVIEQTPESCTCNNKFRHAKLLTTLKAFAKLTTEEDYRLTSFGDYLMFSSEPSNDE